MRPRWKRSARRQMDSKASVASVVLLIWAGRHGCPERGWDGRPAGQSPTRFRICLAAPDQGSCDLISLGDAPMLDKSRLIVRRVVLAGFLLAVIGLVPPVSARAVVWTHPLHASGASLRKCPGQVPGDGPNAFNVRTTGLSCRTALRAVRRWEHSLGAGSCDWRRCRVFAMTCRGFNHRETEIAAT